MSFRWLASVILFGMGIGCAGKPQLQGPSPERCYAESVLLPASALGPGWVEQGRAILARTRWGTLDQSWPSGSPPPLFRGDPRELVKPEGDYWIVAGVGYGKGGSSEPLVQATYLYSRYKALPLSSDYAEQPTFRHLLGGRVKAWQWESDGIACGEGDLSSEVLAAREIQKIPLDAPSSANPEDGTALVQGTLPATHPQEIEGPKPIYLAGDGVLAEIRVDPAITLAERDSIVQGVRRRLADELHREAQEYESLRKEKDHRDSAAHLQQFIHPNTMRVWRGLDALIYGHWIKKRY